MKEVKFFLITFATLLIISTVLGMYFTNRLPSDWSPFAKTLQVGISIIISFLCTIIFNGWEEEYKEIKETEKELEDALKDFRSNTNTYKVNK
jgi:pilus assembly protein TadC